MTSSMDLLNCFGCYGTPPAPVQATRTPQDSWDSSRILGNRNEEIRQGGQREIVNNNSNSNNNNNNKEFSFFHFSPPPLPFCLFSSQYNCFVWDLNHRWYYWIFWGFFEILSRFLTGIEPYASFERTFAWYFQTVERNSMQTQPKNTHPHTHTHTHTHKHKKKNAQLTTHKKSWNPSRNTWGSLFLTITIIITIIINIIIITIIIIVHFFLFFCQSDFIELNWSFATAILLFYLSEFSLS